MGRFLSLLSLVVLCYYFSKAQVTPTSLDSTISIRKVIDVSSNSPVKIDKDPITGDLYYTTLQGNIYKIILSDSTFSYDTLLFTYTDHQISNMQGMCFYDSSMYVTGNTPIDANKKRSGIIKKGKLQNNGNRTWSVVAETERFEAAAFFDHLFTSIIPLPHGDSLLVSSGSRGDHGEVQDFNGMFPGKRLLPISSMLLKIPAHGNNFFIPNDSVALDTLNLIYAEGFRNNFDMAYNADGDLFGTENAGDRDMDEELNWIREGHHYGFPWYMGVELNPSQHPNYDPANDLLINHNSYAWVNGLFTIDTTFPPFPPGIIFTEPCANEGPDADIFRDTISGNLIDATSLGSSKYVYSFTGHRSPLGLTFDTDSIMGGSYRGAAFVCSWTRGDSSLSGYSPLMAGMGDYSEDLLFLDMRKDSSNSNYIFSTTKIIEKLRHPADAVLLGNKMYILETGSVPGPAIWEITFPKFCNQDSIPMTITAAKRNVTCNNSIDGEVQISVSGGIPPYRYSWNTNSIDTSKVLNNLNSGIYVASVIDSRGCSASTSISINQPDPISVVQISTSTNPTGTATGSIDQILSGGTIPYSFHWSNGEISEDIGNLMPGLYYCHITDDSGCAVLVSLTIN